MIPLPQASNIFFVLFWATSATHLLVGIMSALAVESIRITSSEEILGVLPVSCEERKERKKVRTQKQSGNASERKIGGAVQADSIDIYQ